jgi:hypothetical protein
MNRKPRLTFKGERDWSPRKRKKVRDLSSVHGTAFDDMINADRMSIKAVDNFYGRHFDRQSSILAAMRDGQSYSKAYANSSSCFDTIRWSKIAARSASCRGLILKAACHFADETQAGIEDKLLSLVDGISDSLLEQMQHFAQLDIVADERTIKKRVHKGVKVASQSRKKSITDLRTANSKLRKNARDLPRMSEKLGCCPTVREVASVAIESGQMLAIIRLLKLAKESTKHQEEQPGRFIDPWGIGQTCAARLRHLYAANRPRKLIATHRKPDADALVSTWMTDRFVFSGDECEIEFVPRDFTPGPGMKFDAVVDVGKSFDPERLIFDHKPPSFAHRDEHCATSLVWEHAIWLGRRIKKLKPLVELVHDGDAATRRGKSAKYRASRTNGLHAIIKEASKYAESDQILYRGIRAYLDAKYITLGRRTNRVKD